MEPGQGFDTAVLRAHMESFDGRLRTPREVAAALGWPEREVSSQLVLGCREGWIRSGGPSPSGGRLYGYVAPVPQRSHA